MSLAALTAQLPPLRAAHLQQFLRLGWPHRKLEAWRYTDLAPLAAREWAAPALPGDDNPQPIADHDHFALLNGALARFDAAPARVAAGEQAHRQACQAVAAASESASVFRREGQVEGLSTHWQQLQLERDSRHTLTWVSDTQGNGHDLCRLSARIDTGAQLRLVVVHLGRATSRLELDLHLQGERSAVELHVLSLPAAGAFDLPATVHHEAPQATSRLQLRAIGLAGTRSSLNGRIKVYPGAVKTDSEQHMASLLLSPKAEINAKPDLEIDNDDVKCAHGASFGQLDPEALFYLRARGLDAVAARSLLIQAFAQQVLDEVPDQTLRAALSERLLARLREAST
jgi:Fe-S cluster assembly protein SufD